ncbi:MAG: hypothetical protein QXU02_04350 [Candidatus Bathyarchaeia archaeon]
MRCFGVVHVSIQHIIGTVALIGLAISLALAYQIVVGYVEENAIKTQLNQIAEYVSMSITNTISLTDFTYGALSTSEAVSKRLNLPLDLGGKPYNITIVERGGRYYVHASVVGRKDLYAESPITASSTQRIQIFTGGDLPEGLLEGSNIEPMVWVYGGSPNMVVWCRKAGDIIYVGLGLLTGG